MARSPLLIGNAQASWGDDPHAPARLVRKVTRYEVPNLSALNHVLDGVLVEGGSRSLGTDAQGKTLGQTILASVMLEK